MGRLIDRARAEASLSDGVKSGSLLAKARMGDLISNINTLQQKAANLSNQYNSRYFDAQGNALPTQWRADSADFLSSITAERNKIGAEVSSLAAQLRSYRDLLDEDTYRKGMDALSAIEGSSKSIFTSAKNENEIFSQFETADQYNTAVRQSEFMTKWDGMQADALRQEWAGLPDDDRDLMISYLLNYRDAEVPDVIPSEYWKNYRKKLRTAVTAEDALNLRLLQQDYAASAAAGYVGNDDYLKAKEQELKDKYGVDQLDQLNPTQYTTEDGYGVNLNNLIIHAENREMMRVVKQSPQLSQAYDQLLEYSRDAALMQEIASEFDANKTRGLSAEEALAKHAQDIDYLSKTYGIDLSKHGEYAGDVLKGWASKIKSGRYQGQSQHIQALAKAGIDWLVLDNYNDSMATVEAQKEQQKAVHDFAIKYPWAAAPLAIAAAPLTIAEYAGNMLGNIGNTLVAPMFNGGRVMPSTRLGINAYDDKVGNFIDAAHEGVAQTIENDTWRMIYSGVTSAIHSTGTALGSVVAFGPVAGSVVAGLIMASEAAASQYRQSVKKGASPTEATLSSIAAGAAEYVFEQISMGHLFTIKDASPVNLSSIRTITKSLARQFFNQAGHGAIEVSEELMTTLSNLITDGMFDGSYLNEVKSYERLGVDHDMAVKLAGRSLSQQIAESAIGGFIGGFAGGGLAMADSNIASIKQYAQVKKLVAENAEKVAADEVAREDLIDFAQQAIAMTGEKTAERLSVLVAKVREDPSVANVKKLMSAVDSTIKASELAAAKQSVKGVETLSEEQQEIFDQMIAKAERSGLTHDEAVNVAKKEYRQLAKENLKQVKDSSLPYSALAAEHARISRRAEKYAANGQGVDRIAQTEQEVSPTAAHIEQTENGPVFMLTQQDGSSVPAAEISFASVEKAMAVEAIEGTGMDDESAFALYSTLDASTSPTVGRHIANAFRAGTVSLPQAEARGHAHGLTDEQFRLAYQAGQRQADETAQNTPQPQNAGEGGSFYDGTGLSLLGGEFRGSIKAQIVVLHRLSELMGLNLEVYQSKDGVFVDRRGVEHEAQGVFLREGDIIMVDLKAGNNYNGLMINTLAHELVHRIRAWSPAKFKKLADYLMESFGAHGVNVTRLINRQMQKDKTLDYDAAYEEVVADAMEGMLHDGNVIAHVERIRQQDASLGKKLIDSAKELFDKMLNAFRGEEFDAGSETEAGKYAAKMTDRVAELQRLFAEGLADAADQVALATRHTDTVPKNKKPADDAADAKNSLRQFEDGTRFVDVKADQHLFDGLSLAEKTTLARNIIKQRFSGRVIGGENPVFVNGESAKEYSHPARNISDDIRDAKMRSATELDNLIAAGENLRTELDGKDGHVHPGVKNFSYLDVIFKVGNDYYSGIVNIENNNIGKRLKDITKIKNITEDIISSYGNNPKSEFLRDVSVNSISASFEKSNPSEEKKSADNSAVEWQVFDQGAQSMKNMLRTGIESDASDETLMRTSFGRQLLAWRKNGGRAGGAYNGQYFELGKTPQSLVKHGAPNVALIMYDDCLVKITGGKHDTALEEIAKIPQELSDPILLFKGSVPNSFVAVTEIQTKQGHEAIVAIHIHKHHGRNVINKIASLHSRTTDYGRNYIVDYVNKQIKDGNLVDASTKKASTWFTTRGLQLPKVVQTIIDANNSISNPAKKINPTNEKNSKRDSASARSALVQALGKQRYGVDESTRTQYLSVVRDLEKARRRLSVAEEELAQAQKNDCRLRADGLKAEVQQLAARIEKNEALLGRLEQTESMSRLISCLSDRTLTKENTPANVEVKNMKRNVVSDIVDLSKDKRLAQMVGGRHGSVRYNIIRDYILDELKDQPIRMSDGKMAIVDRGDAQHIASRGRYDDKVAQISHIQKIIENAKLVAEENSTKDRKFDYYWYYETRVKYREDILPVYVNLGRARNGEGYHIYDLTNKLRDTAHRVNDVGRPVGNALRSGISIDSTSQLLNMESNDSPQLTSKTPDDNRAINDSISDNLQNSNPTNEKNSKRDRSNRAILEQALRSTANEQERTQINQYLATMHQTERMEEQVDQINRAIATMDKTLQADKIRELRERARTLNEKIGKNDRLIAKLGSQQAIGRVLKRDRKAEGQRYAKQLAEYKDSIKRKEQIRRIKTVVAELHKLLFHPTKEAHIPEPLRAPIAEALSMLNLDDTAGNNFSMQQWLANVRSKYMEIQENADSVVRNMYYAEIAAKMQSALVVIGDTSLHDMSRRQVDTVYEVVSMLRHRVRDVNRLLDRSRNSTVIEHKDHIKADLKKAGRGIPGKKVPGKFAGKALFDELKPVTFFRMINSPTMQYLFQNILDAQYTWAQTVAAATDFKAQLDEKYGAKDWDLKHLYEFTDADGKEFTLTIQQIMSLYGYGKRDAGRRHLFEKGFCFDEEAIANGKKITYNTKDAYRLTPQILAQISEVLSPAQAAYQDEMQQYLHDVMGALGNEVSVALFGVKLFKDPNYLPLSVRQDDKTTMQVTVAPRIVTPGFAKPIDPKSTGAVVVNDFDDVWSRHVAEMAQYHAFALPIDDFTRVFDSRMGADGKTRIESKDSVRAALEENWGKAATDYITKLIRDINGGIHNGQRTFGEKALSTYKKVSTMASLSVIVQQMTSLPRAWALISPKYFLDIKKLKDEDLFHVHGENWDECKKYAPIAIIKEMGRYDTGVSAGTVDYIKGAKKGFNLKNLDDFLSKGPGLMDELAWSLIWNAVKAEIADTTNLRGEELLQEAGRRFTEIIERTQVYDSVLTRSQIMRNSDFLAQTATSFMAEPTVTVNMLIDALMDAKRNGKAGAGRLVRTTASIIASIVMNVLAKSFVYALRDDDEDKTYWEKYVKAAAAGAMDDINPLNWIPFVRDIWSIVKGYDVGRSDMALFADAWNDIQKLFTDELTVDEVLNVVGSICNLVGIPARNVIRDVRAGVMTVIAAFSGRKTTGAGLLNAAKEGWSGKDTNNANQLYAAYVSGDKVAIRQARSAYKTESGADSALISALRENDGRVKQAGKYRFEGDMLKQGKLINEIVAEGHFSQAQVMDAVLAEADACKKKQEPKKEPYDGTFEEVADASDPMSYTNTDLKYAMERGEKTDEIIESMVEDRIKPGTNRKQAKASIRNSVTSTYREKYLGAYKKGDQEEMERIRQMLINTGLWNGSSAVKNVISNWIKNEEE